MFSWHHMPSSPKAEPFPAWKLGGIRRHPSYHGVMTKEAAELKLKQQARNSYLTRYDSNNSSYMLSVMRREGLRPQKSVHFTIKTTKKDKRKQYEVVGTQRKFDYISELLEFYLHAKLDMSAKITHENNTEDVDGDVFDDDESEKTLRVLTGLKQYNFNYITIKVNIQSSQVAKDLKI